MYYVYFLPATMWEHDVYVRLVYLLMLLCNCSPVALPDRRRSSWPFFVVIHLAARCHLTVFH